MVHSSLLVVIQRADLGNDPGQDGGQDGRCNKENDGQLGIEQKRHAQPHEQHDRAAHQRPQAGGHGVEHDRDIGGHAGNEGRGGKMVQVGKVELLQLAVLSFAQSSGKAVGGAGGKPGVQQAGDQGQHSADDHLAALQQNDLHIMAGHALVHQVRHQHRNDHFKNTFHKNQPDGKE